MTLEELARNSVEEGLSPADLIKVYKLNGFKKNARGKPWTTNAVYQHQIKARKTLSDEPQIVEPAVSDNPGVDTLKQFERIMALPMAADKKFELAKRLLNREPLPEAVFSVCVKMNGKIVLRTDSLRDPKQSYAAELSRSDAFELIDAVENVLARGESETNGSPGQASKNSNA